jgi:hypothetical protein
MKTIYSVILLLFIVNNSWSQYDTSCYSKNKIGLGFSGKNGFLGIQYGRSVYSYKNNNTYVKLSLYSTLRPGFSFENVRNFGKNKKIYFSGEFGYQFSNYVFPVYGKELNIDPEDWKSWHGKVLYLSTELGYNWRFVQIGLNTSLYSITYSRINSSFYGIHFPGANLTFKF